jgi:hypothetical protein
MHFAQDLASLYQWRLDDPRFVKAGALKYMIIIAGSLTAFWYAPADRMFASSGVTPYAGLTV